MAEQDKPCPFCEIIQGKRDATVVFADAHCVGFLDARPLFPGHVLLAPLDHIQTFMDLPEGLIGPFFSDARLVCKAVQEAMGSEGIFVAANNRVSQSIPHLHLHIVPRTKGDGLRGFFWPRNKYNSEEHKREVAEKIRQALSEEYRAG